jgi:hypothetical protein
MPVYQRQRIGYGDELQMPNLAFLYRNTAEKERQNGAAERPGGAGQRRAARRRLRNLART